MKAVVIASLLYLIPVCARAADSAGDDHWASTLKAIGEEDARKKRIVAAWEACVETPAHKIAFQANLIDAIRSRAQRAQAALDRDRAIESTSGVADLKLRHEAGSILVDAPAKIQAEFEEYRRAGGTAASPSAVVAMVDPCADILSGKTVPSPPSTPPQPDDGGDWEYTTNDVGVVMTSRGRGVTIYLGKSCDAKSPQYGDGSWEFSNAGWAVTVGNQRFPFPRQMPPFAVEGDALKCRE